MSEREPEHFPHVDESEYHFSEDEANYEVGNAGKSSASTAVPVSPMQSFLAIVQTYQRIILSALAFCVFAFIVFKMISRAGNNSNLDIVPVTAPPVNSFAAMPIIKKPIKAEVNPTPNVISNKPITPNAIPVATNSVLTLPSTISTTVPEHNIASNTLGIMQDNNRLMTEFLNNYKQQLANFSDQNRALADQLQSITTKIASIEAQIGSLNAAMTNENELQNLAKDKDEATSATTAAAASVSAPAKIPLTVQAIIPGRAWLKWDNGEALTITEGDTIPDVGRVMKIDPYDGVVVLKVKNGVVSLTYGTAN